MIKAKFRHSYLPTVDKPYRDIIDTHKGLFLKNDYKYKKSELKDWQDCILAIDFLAIESPLIYIIFGFKND